LKPGQRHWMEHPGTCEIPVTAVDKCRRWATRLNKALVRRGDSSASGLQTMESATEPQGEAISCEAPAQGSRSALIVPSITGNPAHGDPEKGREVPWNKNR
jgi:hypothetical protein